MVQLTSYLSARGHHLRPRTEDGTQRQPANFLDLSDDNGDNDFVAEVRASRGSSPGYRQRYSLCLPSARGTLSKTKSRRSIEPDDDAPAASSPQQRQQRQSQGGISWTDVQHWASDTSTTAAPPEKGHCQHCNMQVSPAATRAWHERMCKLNSGHNPSLCELCYRPFTSLAHARNHYLYGCTPVV
ncbi:hypothetical protein IWW38_006512 [Coemansia aciculifera]|uniref:Uncharacterized protein n=1 Tax=Coemansia aciculifera TaxID=417176 RepID=A0ACC1LRM5_9FUNG|nr:hypothetical protein IWW38_006512 [Coemansia aciculifera]